MSQKRSCHWQKRRIKRNKGDKIASLGPADESGRYVPTGVWLMMFRGRLYAPAELIFIVSTPRQRHKCNSRGRKPTVSTHYPLDGHRVAVKQIVTINRRRCSTDKSVVFLWASMFRGFHPRLLCFIATRWLEAERLGVAYGISLFGAAVATSGDPTLCYILMFTLTPTH